MDLDDPFGGPDPAKLGCRAGLSGWAVRLGCPSPCVAVWLAGWPGRLAGLPGLACPPAPPPLQTPQPAQPANSELARRLGRKEAPATPQKAAPKADNQSSLRAISEFAGCAGCGVRTNNRRNLRAISEFAGCAGCEF